MAPALTPGAVVAGRYRLERALGQGGMGVVWAATHTITQKRVALKFLRGPVHLQPELRHRFLREARAACAVVHPNVLEVHDVFELEDGTPAMLMDLLEGETLGQRIAREGPLSVQETAEILIQVVSAVGTAHAVGVVHRDLKPDNIFLVPTSNGPSVRVLDFGIAKLVGFEGADDASGITNTGAMLGTPAYMSPEQSLGEKQVDYRADIWALGVILYECLSGARPIEGNSIGQIVRRLMSEGIVPIETVVPSLPDDLVRLVHRMLAREVADRLSDLHELEETLSRYTRVRAPAFSTAEIKAEGTSRVVIDTDNSDPSASTHHAPRGPETAGAHTLSSPDARPSGNRVLWISLAAGVTGAGLIGAILFARAPAGEAPPASSHSAATPMATGIASAPGPSGAPTPSAAVVPSAAPPGDEPSETTRPQSRASAVRVPKAATAVVVSPAPSTSAAAPQTKAAGLIERPPF